MRGTAAGAEVMAGRQSNVGLLQGTLAELHGVESGVADVDVDVEGAVRLHGHAEAGVGQTLQDQGAAGGEFDAAGFAHGQGLGCEAGQCGQLRGGGEAQV